MAVSGRGCSNKRASSVSAEEEPEIDFLCDSMSDVEIAAKKPKSTHTTFTATAVKNAPRHVGTFREDYVFRKFGLSNFFCENKSRIRRIGVEFDCKIHVHKPPEVFVDSRYCAKTVYTFSEADLTVIVQEGDITDLEVDMIVTSIGDNIPLEGSLSMSLQSKGGDEFTKECQEMRAKTNKSLEITGGGNLPCPMVMHVPVFKNDKTRMDRLIMDILAKAEDNEAKAIALPALGTGGGGWKSVDVADGMYKGITDFISSRFLVRCLKTVRIVLLPTASSRLKMDFHAAFGNFVTLCDKMDMQRPTLKARRLSKKQTALGKEPGKGAESHDVASAKTRNNLHDGSVKISFYSSYEQNVLEAKQEIEELINLSLMKFSHEDEIICELSQKQTEELKRLGFSRRVGVEIYASIKKIVVQGKTRPAFETLEEIRKLLQSVPKATEGADLTLPQGWLQMDRTEAMLRVPLEFGSEEFTKVVTLFNRTNAEGLIFRVIRVERIQNPQLYRQYIQNKHDLSKQVKDNVLERSLFHGTASDSVDSICKNGFNRAYAGRNGTALGKGTYFSNKSSTSHNYGKRHIFLAGVLTGDFCKGDSSMIDTPLNPINERKFDSAVDNLKNPTVFVIFRDSVAYPTYLITYD